MAGPEAGGDAEGDGSVLEVLRAAATARPKGGAVLPLLRCLADCELRRGELQRGRLIITVRGNEATVRALRMYERALLALAHEVLGHEDLAPVWVAGAEFGTGVALA